MVKKRRIPHTYAIIFYFILFAAFLTWIIPGGQYVEEVIEKDGEQVSEMAFRYVDSQPQTWQVFSALYKGFVRQAGIIVFILMIGGAFWIVNSSKAIDVGIFSFLRFTRKIEKNRFLKRVGVDNIVITLVMLMFSIFGAVFGMSEETIAFIIVMVPLSISMGYDSIVGVSMCFVAAGLGFAGAVLNPFTIGIAQGIAELPLFSGFEYRLFCWVVINAVGIGYVLHYARRVKRDPSSSPVYHDDDQWRKGESAEVAAVAKKATLPAWISYAVMLAGLVVFSVKYPQTNMVIGNSSAILPMVPVATVLFAVSGFITLKRSAQFFILHLLLFTIIFLIIGVMGYGWYIMEIASLFFALGIFSGISMGYGDNTNVKHFLEGVRDIVSAALVVGLAGGIIVILEDGRVIDTILYSLSKSMDNFGDLGAVSVMYVVQNVINIVIPSGSAKAALTMPIMAPFSDLIGISRQATVMAYQFGDGFTNMITPTSGVLIGVLGVAKIPYDKWFRWIGPLMIALLVLGFLLLIPTVTMDLNGF